MFAPSARADPVDPDQKPPANDADHPRPKDQDHNDIGAFPLIGGDSDIGIGAGVVGVFAHYRAGEAKYRYRVEVGGLATYKPSGDPSHIPYQDYYLILAVPELARGISFEMRPSFTRETTQKYYGLGNASEPLPGNYAPTFYEYGRTHPTLEAHLRFRLIHPWYLQIANYLTYNAIDVYEPSRLALDMRSPDPLIRGIVNDAGRHFVDFVEASLLYDTRDDETAPRYGMFHQASVRVSPGGSDTFPYRYEQLDLSMRFYATPADGPVTLAARVVGDIQLEDPPFYELARFQDTFALGGAKGVRGVPGQRYYGKVKVLGNFETRFRLFSFHLLSRKLHFGVATFFDTGRLWVDTSSHPELDGTGLGLKYGTGGGLRIQQASTFVVRLDLAYSPDAHPIGGYFAVGEIF